MKMVRVERKTLAERVIEALTREAEQYVAVGMLDRAALVNVELKKRGAAEVTLPQAVKQTRQSAAASSRSKRG